MIDLNTTVCSARIEVVPWTTKEFLRVYGEVLSLWEQYGWVPDRVGGVKPTRPTYGEMFDEDRRNPAARDIQLDKGIACVKRTDDWINDQDWSARFALNNYNHKGFAHQILGETELGVTSESVTEINRQFLKLLKGQYAYILCQQRRFGYYQMAPATFNADLGQSREHVQNVCRWELRYPQPIKDSLLRDVYPRSFLDEKYLAAPVGYSGMSLCEWIEANPAERGSLSYFTDTLTEWAPPVEFIPQIREELYRGGRLFHWRFYLPERRREGAFAILSDGTDNLHLMEPEPFYRPDLSEPWEAPDSIPDIFTAAYYNDKDPGLIY